MYLETSIFHPRCSKILGLTMETHKPHKTPSGVEGLNAKKETKTLFLDLVPFLLDLDTFHGPYYNSFGDGHLSFGPARPPAGPRPSLLLDLALSQTIPTLDRFPVSVQPRLDRKEQGVGAALACRMACSLCLTLEGVGLKWREAGTQLGVDLGLLLAYWISRLRSTTISCIHLVSYDFMFGSPASPQFLACILLQCIKFPLPVPLNNFLHSCGDMRCQYLSSPPRLSTTSCMYRHLSSMLFNV